MRGDRPLAFAGSAGKRLAESICRDVGIELELELRIAHRLALQPIRWQLQAHPPVPMVARPKK